MAKARKKTAAKTTKKSRPRTKALVVAAPAHHHVARPAPQVLAVARAPARRSRRKASYRPPGLAHLAVAGGVLAATLGTANTPVIGPTLYNAAQKVPGVKTFGGVAVGGVVIGGVARALRVSGRARMWTEAALAVGVVALAIKLGTEQASLKFVGETALDEIARG
jgi:hypothetical protein